jgi:HSP20 family molecular chaperone IbpA
MQDDKTESSGLIDEIAGNLEEIFFGFHDSLFDINDMCLKPLYRVEAVDGNLKVIFDLPFVEKKEDLSLSATEETLSVEAKTKAPVSMMVGGPYQKGFEFDRYRAKIMLPTRVDPDSARAKFRNGMLLVEFSLGKASHPVKIQ